MGRGTRVSASITMAIALVVLQVPSRIPPIAEQAPASAAAFDPGIAMSINFDTHTVVLTPGASQTFSWSVTNTGSSPWVAGTSTEMRLSACVQTSLPRSALRIDCEQPSANPSFNPLEGGWASASRYANQPLSPINVGSVASYFWRISVPAGTPA